MREELYGSVILGDYVLKCNEKLMPHRWLLKPIGKKTCDSESQTAWQTQRVTAVALCRVMSRRATAVARSVGSGSAVPAESATRFCHRFGVEPGTFNQQDRFHNKEFDSSLMMTKNYDS